MKERYEVQYEKFAKMETSEVGDEKNVMIEKIAVCLSWILVVMFLPFSLCLCLIVAAEYQRIVMFRLGRIRNCYGPGLMFLLPCIDSYVTVDIRTDVVNVDPQEMLTKDSVTITVNAVVFYCINHPIDSIVKVDDARDATERISQVTLRNIVGSKPLHELLTSRQQLSREVQLAVAEITGRWGVRVERVDLMEISLPSSLERSLASEAEAVRQARAKIILAEGEAKASKALKEASDVMSENQISLQLRHLQILSSLATERRVNVIFPIPLEIMEPFDDGSESPATEQVYDDQQNDEWDQSDYLNLISPKVYIMGPPPDSFPDQEPSENGNQNGRENEKGRTWKWPPFLRLSRSADRVEQPSSSQPSTSTGTNRAAEVEPYPLLSKPPARSSSAPAKPSPIPLPPRPDPPALPPIPPHPTLPPLPDRPTPPVKSASPPREDSPKVPKSDKNYYF
ncbi:band 7 protein AGAP004871 [Drosophila gunungcola]|uniref:band 7 protein AGAP004871 n=1 Tax=Drosophila gunungcola TaxID=103775 RepID=UPI0022E7C212|nr:band 7 protein AGAP004871 [Drosophila gunungcola]